MGLPGLDAGAQATVYRCGPDGREYSSSPCPGGKAVDVDDARSAEQRRQAQDASRREGALADRLAAERRQREAAVERPGAGRLDAARVADKSASKPQAHKGQNKSKKKARKAGRTGDPSLSPPLRGASSPR